jgi:hypothetical protein
MIKRPYRGHNGGPQSYTHSRIVEPMDPEGWTVDGGL